MSCRNNGRSSRATSRTSCRSRSRECPPIPPIDDLNFMQHWYPDCDNSYPAPCSLSVQYAKEAAYKTNCNNDFVRKSLKVGISQPGKKCKGERKFRSEYTKTYPRYHSCYDDEKENLVNRVLCHVIQLYDEIEEMKCGEMIKINRFSHLKTLECALESGRKKILNDLCHVECKFKDLLSPCFEWRQKAIERVIKKSEFLPSNIAGLSLKLLHHLEKFSPYQCDQCDLDATVCSILKVLRYLTCELGDFLECLKRRNAQMCCSSSEEEVETIVIKKKKSKYSQMAVNLMKKMISSSSSSSDDCC